MKPHSIQAVAPGTDISGWSLEDVPAIARRAGIPALSDQHWKVIASCREEAARTGRPPGLRRLAELTGLEGGELKLLFPGDVEALVTRIAGLSRGRSGTRSRPDGES